MRLASILATLLVLLSSASLAEEPYDLVLAGGVVIDGSGNPFFLADVAIRDGRIARLGDLGSARTERRIDVTGRTIVPGFIDLHSHADGPGGHETGLRSMDRERRGAPNLVSQGVTTVVVNQDGGSPSSIAEQRATLEELGFGPNVVLMVGHNTIRRETLGDGFDRLATDVEIATMKESLRQGVVEGAWGLTAGLEYIPGRYSDTLELVELVSVLAEVGGLYIVHERASGSDPMWFLPSRHPPGAGTMLDSIRETIEVARTTGVPTVATHVKVRGADYWGSAGAIVQLMRKARRDGVEIWLDQYPYDTTGSDGNTLLIPPWALEVDRWGASGTTEGEERDYAALLRRVLENGQARADLERDVAREIERRGGKERIFIFDHPSRELIGKTLGELSRQLGVDPVSAAIRLQLEGFPGRPGGARLRGFSLSEIDMAPLMAEPYTITASDAGIALASEGRPVHARFYGTFPRKIRRYALERQVISVADAIRSATSLPATVLRLADRGLVREGLVADLVVLDLERLRDRATFTDPHQLPEGVDWVFIAGAAVVEEGSRTGALPGRVLELERSRFAIQPVESSARDR